MTKEFIEKRILEQYDYIDSILEEYNFDPPIRQQELVKSATGQLNYFKEKLKQLNKMDYKKYQEESARTFSYRKESLDTETTDALHCVIGMVTESAELMDAFKKHIFYGKALDEVNTKEEIGDIMWYIANFCRLKGYYLEEIMQTNINKLKVRYPEKFTNELADNRNLDAERKELEK